MIRNERKTTMLLKAAGLMAVMAVVFFTGKKVGAATAQPGSQSDPLVTLSYLETRLKEGGVSGTTGSGTAFREVSLTAGEKLTLSDGAEAVVIRGNGSIFGGGLINLTSGEMFKEGTSIVLYSDFLSAGSGCGIKASGSMKAYVKGSYTIN